MPGHRPRETCRLLRMRSPYNGATAALSTKHGKQAAIAPPLDAVLGLKVRVPPALDTDRLGTFTGEVARVGTPLEVAFRKARMGMEATGLPLGLASEGSFGPDPRAPIFPLHQEILVLVDHRLGTQVAEQVVTNRTNFGHREASSMEELTEFLRHALFPSHALVVRPNTGPETNTRLHKGVVSVDVLRRVLRECASASPDGKARVETDMRAHVNPTRMAVLRRVSFRLARRLLTPCPACGAPGWGVVGTVKGLPCEHCGYPTELVSALVEACPRCAHRSHRPRPDGRTTASAAYCPRCNP